MNSGRPRTNPAIGQSSTRTRGLRVRRADYSATLPPVYDDDDDDDDDDNEDDDDEEDEDDDVMKTTASIELCLRHWLTLVMNHTDSLEVWASLHKNAGNHLHSQEDPLSKKGKNALRQLKTTLIFSVLRSLLRSHTSPRDGGKETKRYVDRQSE